MKNEDKLKVFETHLSIIKCPAIKSFTKYSLLRVPDYFWTLAASTSGRRHGGEKETLVDHIQGCLFIAESTIRQFKGHWKQRQKDQLLSAVMLHDGWRCGWPGKEERFTQEQIDKKGYSQKKLGQLRTSADHPEVGYRQLIKIADEFNKERVKSKRKEISVKDLSVILKAVRYHYGPFMEVENRPFSLDWPYSSVVVQCHNIDFHQAHNAKWWSCRTKKHE